MAEKLRNNDNVINKEDPNLKNSRMNCAHVLRDVSVMVFLKKTLGQFDEKSEDQIPNNDVGEEVHVNNNGE